SARGGRDQSGPARARDLHRPLLGDPAAGPRLSSQLAAPSTASLEPRPDKTPPRTQPAHPTARVQRRRPALPRRLLRPLHQQPRRTGPANDEGQDEDLRRLPHLRGRMRLRRRALARCNRPQARLEHPPDPNRPPSFPHSDPVRVTPTLGVTNFPWIARNPLKSPESDEGIQGNPTQFFLVFLGLALIRLEEFGLRRYGVGRSLLARAWSKHRRPAVKTADEVAGFGAYPSKIALTHSARAASPRRKRRWRPSRPIRRSAAERQRSG